MKNTIYVGIDPAARKSGNALACFIPETQNFYCKTFATLSDIIIYLTDKAQTHLPRFFLIENSNLQTTNFQTARERLEQSNASAFYRGLCVGKNQHASQFIFDYCTQIFAKNTVRQISPTEKGAKLKNKLLLNNYLFDNLGYSPIINYSGKETQDAHDAIKLALLAYLLDTETDTKKLKNAII